MQKRNTLHMSFKLVQNKGSTFSIRGLFTVVGNTIKLFIVNFKQLGLVNKEGLVSGFTTVTVSQYKLLFCILSLEEVWPVLKSH